MTTASTVKTKDKFVRLQDESGSWHVDMRSVDIGEIEGVLGRCLGKLKKEAVAIMKDGQTEAVVISAKEYAHLKEMAELQEDAYLAEMADEIVAKDDWLGTEESEKFLNEMRNAKD